MKLTRKLHRIQSSLLLHELSFLLLILITTSTGIIWAFAWQLNSEESLRLTTMNTHAQNIRSNLYRQLKEVFDATFLADKDAIDEYAAYTKRIEIYIDDLERIAVTGTERKAIAAIDNAYDHFRRETEHFLQYEERSPRAEQTHLLDEQLENRTFTKLETAFSEFEILLENKQQLLARKRQQWMSNVLMLLPIPVLLAISLLLFSRRYVKRNVIKPLNDVMAGARLISKGNLQHKIAEYGVADLARLAGAINSMADDLATSRDKLVDAQKQAALGELVPLMAHNIRNPLAGIRAAAQVTLEESAESAVKDTLNDIILAVDRLERWVTSLLTYLHPIKPHYSHENMLQIVDNVLSLMLLQLQEKSINIEKQGWSDKAVKLLVDVNLLEQAVFNLLQNALEASPRDSVLTLCYQEQTDKVCLTITDQGGGLTFDPVVEKVTAGEIKRLSYGLGIPFSLKVVKQHGGYLRYESMPAQSSGTAVTLCLPVKTE